MYFPIDFAISGELVFHLKAHSLVLAPHHESTIEMAFPRPFWDQTRIKKLTATTIQ
jgi:hypothetical protein